LWRPQLLGIHAVSPSEELTDALDELGLKQHVSEPTRSDHLLDVLATDPALVVSAVVVVDAGYISDHRLVKAMIALDTDRHDKPVAFTYRRIQSIDCSDFERRLRCFSLFTLPASTAESFAEQLKREVVATLDVVAPVRRIVRRPPKAVTKFLSAEAIEAKRLRRRLEIRWRAKGPESDRVAYRLACRQTKKHK
jgi:hypothetical protein